MFISLSLSLSDGDVYLSLSLSDRDINLSLSLSLCSVVSNVEERGRIRQQTNSEKQKKKQTSEAKQQIQLRTAVVTQKI